MTAPLKFSLLSLTLAVAASPADTLRIDATSPTAPVAPSLYGLFFEEINHAGDGGLYGELIQNRSFEETLPIEGTAFDGEVCRGSEAPSYITGKGRGEFGGRPAEDHCARKPASHPGAQLSLRVAALVRECVASPLPKLNCAD